jgi:hypothetical protein
MPRFRAELFSVDADPKGLQRTNIACENCGNALRITVDYIDVPLCVENVDDCPLHSLVFGVSAEQGERAVSTVFTPPTTTDL